MVFSYDKFTAKHLISLARQYNQWHKDNIQHDKSEKTNKTNKTKEKKRNEKTYKKTNKTNRNPDALYR